MEKRIREMKMTKFFHWDKEFDKQSCVCTSKAKQKIHSKLPISSAMFWKAMVHHMLQSLGKTDATTLNLHPSFFFCSFYCWSQCHMAWNIPLVSCDQLSQLCPLTAPCAPQSPYWGSVWGAEKTLMMSKQCPTITKTSLSYQHCFQYKFKL